MTCWDNPDQCRGCHYCHDARHTDNPVWPLTPAEAHEKDFADAMAARGGVLVGDAWEVAK